MKPKFVGVFYHSSQNLPITMTVSNEYSFVELCQSFSTDWAHLLDMKTGEIISSWLPE